MLPLISRSYLLAVLLLFQPLIERRPAIAPSKFRFVVKVHIEGQPSSVSPESLLTDVVDALNNSQKLNPFEFVENEEGTDQCADLAFCDRITLSETVATNQDLNVQLVLRIWQGAKTALPPHSMVKIPVPGVMACYWSAIVPKNWRLCPEGRIEEIIDQLLLHVKLAHPDFQDAP
jgi:hypothetical protein